MTKPLEIVTDEVARRGQVPTENEIRNACAEYLLFHGWLVIRINSGAAQPERKSGKRGFIPFNRWQVLGDDEYIAGVFDLLCFRDFEQPLAIDTKVPGKTLSEVQRHFMAEWVKHGGRALVVTSIDDLERALDQ